MVLSTLRQFRTKPAHFIAPWRHDVRPIAGTADVTAKVSSVRRGFVPCNQPSSQILRPHLLLDVDPTFQILHQSHG